MREDTRESDIGRVSLSTNYFVVYDRSDDPRGSRDKGRRPRVSRLDYYPLVSICYE